MYEVLALGSSEAVTWSDLLFIGIAVLVILAILFLLRHA